MPQNVALTQMEAERAELTAVAEALARSPRLAKLLLYVGEKYFSGERDQLTEYNIATEVFGRSKMVFDSGEDAIARVEAHRLRKRLKEYYEREGKHHAVHIGLPPGSYAPIFTSHLREVSQAAAPLPFVPIANATAKRESVSDSKIVDSAEQLATQESPTPTSAPPTLSSHLTKAVVVLAILLTAGLALWLRIGSGRFPSRKQQDAVAVPASPQSTPGAAKLPLRIMAGYSGPSQIDSAGQTWQPDMYFHGGGLWRRPDSPISRTSDPLLFKQWRSGDFGYDIPLAPGTYELHLYFVTTEQPVDNFSTFTIWINGERVLPGFDIDSDALGTNVADERVFRDVSPGNDGWLHLGFTSERGAPALNALEVLQGTPHRQLPIRIATQPGALRDHNGDVWHPDTYFMGGRLRSEPRAITGTADPDLFSSERYGHFTYAIPVDQRGRFTLVLHFAELYFGPQVSGQGGTGSRVFRVLCNGETLLDEFDIFKEAGSLNSLVKTFHHIKPTAQGKLNLTFEPIENNATISGIEILDESH